MFIKCLCIIKGMQYFVGRHSLIRRFEAREVLDRLNIEIAGSNSARGQVHVHRFSCFCVATDRSPLKGCYKIPETSESSRINSEPGLDRGPNPRELKKSFPHASGVRDQ